MSIFKYKGKEYILISEPMGGFNKKIHFKRW